MTTDRSERRKGAVLTLRRRLVVAMLITVFAIAGYGAYNLRVDEIRVTGLKTLDPRKVIETSGLDGGERLLWIRLSAVAHRVERIPAVESVIAERSFPETVVIRVRERTPLARLGDPHDLSVDGSGRIFASPFSAVLPLVEGWRGSPKPGGSLDRRSIVVLDALADFPQALRRRIVRIVIGPPLTVVLDDGTEIRFGYHIDLVHKAAVAQAVITAEGAEELAYVDVRAPGVPVSRERPPPTPVPTPVPARTPSPAATATAAPSPATTPSPAP